MQQCAYSVLHGFQASAGQPGLLAKGLRSRGVNASNVVVGPNRYGYLADYVFPDSSRNSMRRILGNLAANVDIIHIHAITPFFTRGGPNFPMGTDLLALKAAGKKIIVHFRGSEIRLASVFAAASPYHYVEDDPEGLIAKFPEDGQRSYIDLCRCLADEIVVSDPELLSYVPDAKVIRRAIDLQSWNHVGLLRRERPLVVHAPSRQGVKGTRHVLTAVENLRSKGVAFDFRLLEGLPQSEARKVYEEADIVIDQLRIGWYGVLAVEAMALGKAVVSYVRDDLVSDFDGEPPIYIANPETIESAIEALVASPALREEVALRGHVYCRQVHDLEVVSQSCSALYEDVLARPSRFDVQAYMNVNAVQEEFAERVLVAAKKRAAENVKVRLAADTATKKPAIEILPAILPKAPPSTFSLDYLLSLKRYYQRVGARSFLLTAIRKLSGGSR